MRVPVPLVVVAGALALAGCGSGGQPVTTATVTASASTVVETVEPPPTVTVTVTPTAAGAWTYSTEEGSTYARVGASDGNATLNISHHEAGGRLVEILLPDVPRTDLACEGDCRAGVSVDGGPPQEFQLSPLDTQDLRFTVVDDQAFVSALAAGNSVGITLPVQNSQPAYLFPVEGLDVTRVPTFG